MVSQKKNSSKSANLRPVWMPALSSTKILLAVNEPASLSLYHHLAERNKGCSCAIVFANDIDRVGEFPRIAAYTSNHVIGLLEVATDQDKNPSFQKQDSSVISWALCQN
jgi:hypothetical protein